jgi:hypothetical protein
LARYVTIHSNLPANQIRAPISAYRSSPSRAPDEDLTPIEIISIQLACGTAGWHVLTAFWPEKAVDLAAGFDTQRVMFVAGLVIFGLLIGSTIGLFLWAYIRAGKGDR